MLLSALIIGFLNHQNHFYLPLNFLNNVTSEATKILDVVVKILAAATLTSLCAPGLLPVALILCFISFSELVPRPWCRYFGLGYLIICARGDGSRVLWLGS